MKAGYTLAWSEGTFLTQQHFQSWEQLLHESQWSWVKVFVPYCYGLIRVEWDEEAIRQGICRLKKLKYVTQTGHVISYDDKDMPAVECELNERAGNAIYLHWAQNNECEGLTGYQNTQPVAQYHVSYHAVKDAHDGERAQDIALKRYHIVLSQHARGQEGTYSMPIARVQHQVGSHFVFDHQYIPSAMCMSASSALKSFVQRVTSNMSDKLVSLRKQLDKKWDAKTYIDFIQWSNVWVSLNLMHRHQVAHPFQLYRLFTSMIHQAHLSLPEYHHESLTSLFEQIEAQLKSLWAIEVLPEEEKIGLTQLDTHHFTTGRVSLDVIRECDWYLGVSMPEEDTSWVRQFVQQVKLATQETLPSVLMSALPGISLQPVQRPPSSIALKSGYEYFRLKKQDGYWESLVTHQNMIVYLPKPFHQATLSLDIVRE